MGCRDSRGLPPHHLHSIRCKCNSSRRCSINSNPRSRTVSVPTYPADSRAFQCHNSNSPAFQRICPMQDSVECLRDLPHSRILSYSNNSHGSPPSFRLLPTPSPTFPYLHRVRSQRSRCRPLRVQERARTARSLLTGPANAYTTSRPAIPVRPKLSRSTWTTIWSRTTQSAWRVRRNRRTTRTFRHRIRSNWTLNSCSRNSRWNNCNASRTWWCRNWLGGRRFRNPEAPQSHLRRRGPFRYRYDPRFQIHHCCFTGDLWHAATSFR